MAGGGLLPPGFRFHPTDEELVGYYLKRKIEGLEFELEVIPVIDLYKFDPWELPDKSFLPQRDMEWFFFCPRDKKYPNGSRTNRATKAGYWKATGKDRRIVCQSSVTGFRKTLVFYRGRAPLGDRTEWVMNEYRLCDNASAGSSIFQGEYALCRVIKKSEPTRKTSECRGEPKEKGVGSSSSDQDCSSGISPHASRSGDSSHYSSPVPRYDAVPTAEFQQFSIDSNHQRFPTTPNFMLDTSNEFSQGQGLMPEYFSQCDMPAPVDSWRPFYGNEISPSPSCSNFATDDSVSSFDHGGHVSSYSTQGSYAGFFGEFPPDSYDHSDSQSYRKPL